MRFLKELIARKLQADREEDWEDEAEYPPEEEALAEDEPEDEDWEADLPASLAPQRNAAPPAPAAEPAPPRDRAIGTTYELARSFTTTEMRNLLNRVATPDPAPQPAAAPAAAAPAQAEAPRPAKIWDLQGANVAPRPPEPAEAVTPDATAPRPPNRQRTRLLGFQHAAVTDDIFDAAKAGPGAGPQQFPTGWIVVVEGPGRGACYTLGEGVSQIGRGADQSIRLDFGDTSISRNNHAAVAFDPELGKFFLGHGGKSNLVRLNGRPVLSTEELATGDVIRIGETVLRFVALCGDGFSWAEEPKRAADAASA